MAHILGNTTYYDPTEVAQVLGSHYETVLRRIKNGDIKSHRINNGYIISHEDLVEYLDVVEALPESIIELRLHAQPINKVASGN